MMQQPMVSVVIPAYRCAETISLSINSALAQEVALEVLVIDDCPESPIDQVMEQYNDEPRVIYLRNPKNMGAAETRNRGIALAKAPYVAFLDADDIWRPGKLKKQLEALERTGYALCCTARELMTVQGVFTGKVIPVKEDISYKDLLKHNCINCSSVVIRTEVIRQFPMSNAESHEDYITWLRVLRAHGNACGINEPLLQYRLSNTGKSGSKLKSAKMTFMVYRRMGFGIGKSLMCFCSYAFHGVKKYLFTKRKANEAQ
jgi:teichuronic acid biosynthesis glycosyltransferase TuaG